MLDFAKLKICFLAGTLEHGGAERQLFYMLQALRQRGATPRVLCFDRGQFWEEPIRSLGVPVTWVGQRQSRLARLIRVVRELRRDPPDVFQSQHFFANGYVSLAAFLLGVKAIGAMRNEGTAEIRKNGPIGGWLNLHLPRIIAANSRLAIQQAIARGVPPTRLNFLPNVVDTQRFQSADGSVERPLTLLTIGRLVPEKRFDLFISALARLQAAGNGEVRGWIVGPTQDHALRKKLEAQAARFGLWPGCLQFLGAISNMGPLYQQADICVLTSDYEGTPNVLLEAMSSGLPVVATKVGGVPEIVQHGKTGMVLNRDDLEGLVVALAELIANPHRRRDMGRCAREHVEQHHSLRRLLAYLEDLYVQALSPRHTWKLDFVEDAPA